MKKSLETVVGIALVLGIFIGGPFVIIRLTSPEPHVPYRGVSLLADARVVTSRSWYRPSFFSLETYDAFQRRPVALKWLADEPTGIRLDTAIPEFGNGAVLILIHGYNAPESKVGSYFAGVLAMLRSAIGSNGTIIVYDWPSTARHWEELTSDTRRALIDPGGGPRSMQNPWAPISHEIRDYRADQATARRHGAEGLVELLHLLNRGGKRPITIVAHSMGALVALEALRRTPSDGPTIETIVLLAPDLPDDALGQHDTSKSLGRVRRMLVLHSRHDKALWYSEIANKGKRLGRSGHAENSPLPANVTLRDVTDFLGGESIAVHGQYLERAGAEAIGLADLVVR